MDSKSQLSIVALIAGIGAVFMLGKNNVESVITAQDVPEFEKWDALFRANAAEYSVPWRWLKAICMNESNLGKAESVAVGIREPANTEDSVSSDGKSWGLMQLTLATARGLEGLQIEAPYLNDPSNSVRLGAKLVAQLINRFGLDDRESVIRAYNGGPGFSKTFLGQTSTPIYYARFIANLALVMNKQPGDELEY